VLFRSPVGYLLLVSKQKQQQGDVFPRSHVIAVAEVTETLVLDDSVSPDRRKRNFFKHVWRLPTPVPCIEEPVGRGLCFMRKCSQQTCVRAVQKQVCKVLYCI